MEYNNTNSKIKYLSKPIIILTAVVSMLTFSIFFGINQVNDVNQKVNSANVSNNQLVQKIDVLKDVQEVISDGVSFAEIALPSKGVILFGMSQVKNKADSLGLTIQNLKVSSATGETNGIEKVSISFDISGDNSNLFLFLDSFEKTLPLAKVNKMSLIGQDENYLATVTLDFYSASPLKKIPSLTGQINGLTNEEMMILQELSEYEVPEFGIPTVNEFPAREDIFN